MMNIKVIKRALAASLAAGALCFAATAADIALTPEPAAIAEPAPAGPTATSPFTGPRYFNPTLPREDNPTNPPGTWEVYPSPTNKHLTAVDFIDVNNGWAVGDGVALRYRNGTWVEIPGHAAHAFSGVSMLNQNYGWAVGWDGSKELPAIWRWNGSDWKEFQNPTGAVYCIDMINTAQGWIGGNGYFLRYNGTSWEYGGSAPNAVYGIQMFSDTSGWAVGAPGIVMRRSGGNWQRVPAGSDWMLADVSMIGVNNGWATGYKRYVEKGLIVKCVAGVWTEYKVYDNVRSIAETDIYQYDFGWCCGWTRTSPPYGAFLAFFDGSAWDPVTPPTNKGLLGIGIIDRNVAWIVGETGIILKYKPNVSIRDVSLGQIKAVYR